MKNVFLRLFVVAAILFLLAGICLAQHECFTIVVGKDASIDGSVIVGHNEDDGPPQIVNHRKIPRLRHPPDEKIALINGGMINQVKETWGYIWSEMPGLLFSDTYSNEWGVCVTSNNCPSREDSPEFTDGGISYMLRRLVAQRAKTAREGVRIAGELVERFGYDASGRTLVISDPDEGWFMCLINGKRWLAQRVPDDQVAMISNTYAVHGIDLADKHNSLGSSDIIEYAVSRGWYRPGGTDKFDFAAAYANPEAVSDSGNICRKWSALNRLSDTSFAIDDNLPFAVTPKRRVSPADVMAVLRSHYEGTELYKVNSRTGDPHLAGINSICNRNTQTSFVAQLRRDMPLEIGVVYWVCLGHPCSSVYIPFHWGITQFPREYDAGSEQPSPEDFIAKIIQPLFADTTSAFWTFSNFCFKVEAQYNNLSAKVRKEILGFENRAMLRQKKLEQEALKYYSKDREFALALLSNYSNDLLHSAFNLMNELLKEN